MPSRARLVLVIAIFLPLATLVALNMFRPAAGLDLASPRPTWTVRLNGLTGDVVAVWVWTPRKSVLTNVVLPAELRLSPSCLLLQASNRPGNPLKLVATHRQGGIADIGWITTSNSITTFVSTLGRVFPQIGGFGTAVAPFGSRPAFEHPFALNFTGFEAAPEFPAGAAVTGPNR
jgi:hypothetical protein